MSWTFIAMLLLVVGLIAANLALLKHGSKKNQRPLKNNKHKMTDQQQHKTQAAATTAPVLLSDTTTPDSTPPDSTETNQSTDTPSS